MRNSKMTCFPLAVAGLCAMFACAEASPAECENVASVEGREASLLPKGRAFKLVWHDEFLVDYVRVYDIVE